MTNTKSLGRTNSANLPANAGSRQALGWRRPKNLTPWRLAPTVDYLEALRQADEAVFAVLSRGFVSAKKA